MKLVKKEPELLRRVDLDMDRTKGDSAWGILGALIFLAALAWLIWFLVQSSALIAQT